jgi:hypothetical protein
VSAIGSSFAATSSFSHSVLSASSALPDNSQKGLEKVIKARLVATFLAITLSSEGVSDSVSQSATPWPPLTPPHSAKEISSHRKGALSSSSISHEKTHSSPLKPITKSTRSTPPRSAATTSTIPHQKTSVKPSLRLNGKLPASSTSTASRKLTTSPPINPELPSPTTHEPLPKVPNYLSPVHRPSTNPVFPIDAGHEFSHWSDLSGDRLKIEVWGNVELGWQGDGNGSVKGKGKDKEGIHGSGMEYGEEWKVLEEWNISLADLVPLPTDVSHFCIHTIIV